MNPSSSFKYMALNWAQINIIIYIELFWGVPLISTFLLELKMSFLHLCSLAGVAKIIIDRLR